MPNNDNMPCAPIQVLSVACTAFSDPDPRCAWLHGYALLTIQPTPDDVHLTGVVRTGERWAVDHDLISALEQDLDPRAHLAGLDLTGMIGRLGRLPIESIDQKPALALLAKLGVMLEGRHPIELTIDVQSQAMVALKVVEYRLMFTQNQDDDGLRRGLRLFGCPDNLNANHLAAELADTAGAAALAIGELYLAPGKGAQLASAWSLWRRDFHARRQFEQVEFDSGRPF